MSTSIRASAREFLAVQKERVLLRFRIVRMGLFCVAFWTAALIAGSWMAYFGLAALAWTLLVAWLILAVPSAILQGFVLLDTLNYILTRRAFVAPIRVIVDSLSERAKEFPASETAEASEPGMVGMIVARLVLWAGISLPSTALFLWSIEVLRRVPASAYAYDPKAVADSIIRLAQSGASRGATGKVPTLILSTEGKMLSHWLGGSGKRRGLGSGVFAPL